MAMATRGDLAFSLFNAMGIKQPTSSGKFGDSGYLDGITSTLTDLGITNGVGPKTYGTTQQTTRGQAFTMIARALGLADKNTSIEDASKALVSAGIVKGYGTDPGNIGINDPLEAGHLRLLMNRLAPELQKPRDAADPSKGTIGDDIIARAAKERDVYRAEDDPTFAAFLQAQGLRRSEIENEIGLRTDRFDLELEDRKKAFSYDEQKSREGIQMDFENRGFYRSGTRQRKEAENQADYLRQLKDANAVARNSFEEWRRSQTAAKAELDRQTDAQRVATDTRRATDTIEEQYS
jgi:hypothetical protein